MLPDERATGAVFGARLGAVTGAVGRLLAIARALGFTDLPAVVERTVDDGADMYGEYRPVPNPTPPPRVPTPTTLLGPGA